MEEYGKVLAYVVRPGASGGLELLVFTHRDQPEAGLQVPAGTIDHGESPEVAVLRELAEESGLTGLPITAMIDRYTWVHPATGNRHHRHVFRLDAGSDLPANWNHIALGSAEEEGLTFCFRWMPHVEAVAQLSGDQGRSLAFLQGASR
jgi:8-oxo-dGTP pyrophosphatase MutT (NUDIX family)